MWFWPNDHKPPHFHAKRSGEWEIRVYFLRVPNEMVELVWAEREPANQVLRDLVTFAERHRRDLLSEWETVHRN